MFPTPATVKTEVYARIPDRLRKAGQLSAERLAAGKGTLHTDCFIEGPTFDAHGNLYLTDIAFGRIFRIPPGGEADVVAEYDGEPNGMKVLATGRLLVADHRCGLLEIDPATGDVTPVVQRFRTETFKGLNDLFNGSQGETWFTDQGQTGLQDPSGRVFRREADGHLTCLLDTVPSPNGIVVNPARTQLYVAATRGNCVWRAMLLPDGSATRAGVFVQMSGGTGPDGLLLDPSGRLYVAHAGMGAVWVFSKRGEPLLRIESCMDDMTTNIVLHPTDPHDLYITESHSGCVLRARVD
ncbi:SMP-30/gluconolactonase/LRE family protein [soil metagenome]